MKQDIICPGPLTEEALTQAVEAFLMEVRPGRERLYDYYRSQQPVPKGEAVRGRPNNLLCIPFPRYITEVHTGYFLGLPPTLDFPREADGAAFHRLSDDSFAGNTSCVALQYKLWGIEQVHSAKERSFTLSLKAQLTTLSGGLATLDAPAELDSSQIIFYKNLPQDQAAQAEALLSLSPVLSRRTILEHVPWGANPEEELRRIEKEETKE